MMDGYLDSKQAYRDRVVMENFNNLAWLLENLGEERDLPWEAPKIQRDFFRTDYRKPGISNESK